MPHVPRDTAPHPVTMAAARTVGRLLSAGLRLPQPVSDAWFRLLDRNGGVRHGSGTPRQLPAVLGPGVTDRLPSIAALVAMVETMDPIVDPRPEARSVVLQQKVPAFREVRTEDLQLASADPDAPPVPARLYRPPRSFAAPYAGGLVWVHGGAFVSGDLETAEANWTGMALAAAGIPVLSVDYRKSLHGTVFPAAARDVAGAWRWAAEHATTRIGVPREALHLGGASAGATLASSVSQWLRDQEEPLPASLTLAYPLLHDHLPDIGRGPREIGMFGGTLRFSPGWVRDLAAHYAGGADLVRSPYAFAGRGETSGLPPHLILTCEYDALQASGIAYAHQLEAAGTEVVHDEVPHSVHGALGRPRSREAWWIADRLIRWTRDGAAALAERPRS